LSRNALSLVNIERSRDCASDAFGSAANGIVVEMGVTSGGRGLRMAKQFADNREPDAATSANACERKA